MQESYAWAIRRRRAVASPRRTLAQTVTLRFQTLVIVVIVVPLVVTAASLVGRPWFPAYDSAAIALRVADVGGRHTPLVGVFSRFGWKHPGPLLLWVLAPFWQAAGGAGLLFGAVLVNALGVVGTLIVAGRRGRRSMLIWAGVCLALLCHSLGSAFLIDPWNPYIHVTGLALFFLLAWSVACGDVALWPWLVGVGSWEVQAHVGFVVVVVGALLFVVVRRLAARRGLTSVAGTSSLGHPGWWALGIGVALWAAPIAQQVTGHPGNLQALLDYALHGHAKLGFEPALHIASRELAIPPPWITGHDSVNGVLQGGPVWPAAAEIVLLLILGVAAWRRKRYDAAAFATLALIAVGAGVVSIAEISGIPFPYLARWMWVVSMLVAMAAGWCLIEVIKADNWLSRLGMDPAVVGLCGVLPILLMTALTLRTSSPPVPGQNASDALRALAAAAEVRLDSGQQYAVVPVESDVLGNGVSVGLDLALVEDGYQAYLPPTLSGVVGQWRTTAHRHIDEAIDVVSRPNATVGFRAPRAWLSIAHWDPLTRQERLTAIQLERRIRRSVAGRVAPNRPLILTSPIIRATLVADGASPADVVALAQLQRYGDVYDVYLHRVAQR